jgi:hypothetical protein
MQYITIISGHFAIAGSQAGLSPLPGIFCGQVWFASNILAGLPQIRSLQPADFMDFTKIDLSFFQSRSRGSTQRLHSPGVSRNAWLCPPLVP